MSTSRYSHVARTAGLSLFRPSVALIQKGCVMKFWPFVTRKAYEWLKIRVQVAENNANYSEKALRRVQGEVLDLKAALKEASKNDHRRPDGRFVSAARNHHRPGCHCFGCRPLKGRKQGAP